MKIAKYGAIALAALLLAACGMGLEPISDVVEAAPLVLPDDVVLDTVRDAPEEFTFETFVSVDVDLNVSVVPLPEEGRRPTARAFAPTLVVSITDAEDNLLYRGVLDEEGDTQGWFAVPTATESVFLAIDGVGVIPRTIEITNPAELASVVRDLWILPVEDPFLARVAADPIYTDDYDGDGVPDFYDYDPGNDKIAFAVNVPAEGVFTVAYEDLYPEIGDGDYNDFVVVYSMTLYIDNTTGGVTYIEGSATARARAAGYDHEFGIYMNIPNFSGTVTSYYYSNTGSSGAPSLQVPVQTNAPVDDDVRIILFPSTKDAFDRPEGVDEDNGYPDEVFSVGKTAEFYVFPDAGIDPPPAGSLPAAPFDPYIVVDSPRYDKPVDVHLFGRDPLPGSDNPGDVEGFIDDEGFPWALLVPADFAHPSETTGIWDAYPGNEPDSGFMEWVASDGDTDKDWYLFPDPDLVVKMPGSE